MTTPLIHIENRLILKQLNIPAILKSITHHLKRMLVNKRILEEIAQFGNDVEMKYKSINYLKKQYKLIEIAEELKERVKSFRKMDTEQLSKLMTSGQLQQFKDEYALLEAMHFNVTKEYFSFIRQYHKPSSSKSLKVA